MEKKPYYLILSVARTLNIIEYLSENGLVSKLLIILSTALLLVIVILLFGDKFQELRIFNLDYSIKTGKVDSSNAIELLIINL